MTMSGRVVSDYLSVEYPATVDLTLATEYDMEFYSAADPLGKRLTQLSPAKLPELCHIDTEHNQPINLAHAHNHHLTEERRTDLASSRLVMKLSR